MSKRHDDIAWSRAPDPDGGVYYPLRSPKPGHDVDGIVLSECIEGVIVYYVPPLTPGQKGHSLPCTCGEQPCPGRIHHRDHRWKGYLACWDKNKGRLFLAEVTKEAYIRCPQFEVYKGQLRGKILRLSRSGLESNSRCKASLMPYHGPLVELPTAFNVQSALERIWFSEQGSPDKPRKPGVGFNEVEDDDDESGVPVG